MSFKSVIHSLVNRSGYSLVPRETAQPLLSFFAMLKQRNFQPNLIYDVGANHGNWTRCALEYFPQAAYTLIEPQVQLKSHVEDLIKKGARIEWIPAGAGREPGIQWFNIAEHDHSSGFVLQPDGQVTDQRRIQVE